MTIRLLLTLFIKQLEADQTSETNVSKCWSVVLFDFLSVYLAELLLQLGLINKVKLYWLDAMLSLVINLARDELKLILKEAAELLFRYKKDI